MVNDGSHVVAEPEVETRQLFQRGCELGDGDSCGNASISCLKEGFKDVMRAFQFAKRGDSLSCVFPLKMLLEFFVFVVTQFSVFFLSSIRL